MAYKTILVHSDTSRGSAPRIALAARITAWWAGHLLILHTPDPDRRDAAESDYMAERDRGLASEAQVSCDWLALPTRTTRELGARGSAPGSALSARAGVLSERARAADLAVIGPLGPRPAGDESIDSFAAEVVLAAGRPVLVVPTAARTAAFADRIVIAWNGTRESARAVADSMPFLTRAKDVLLLGDTDPPDAITADLLANLARSEIRIERRSLARSPADAGVRILEFCEHERADLLVMGAYGHPSASEMVAGGVTQTIIESAPLPVLMSH